MKEQWDIYFNEEKELNKKKALRTEETLRTEEEEKSLKTEESSDKLHLAKNLVNRCRNIELGNGYLGDDLEGFRSLGDGFSKNGFKSIHQQVLEKMKAENFGYKENYGFHCGSRLDGSSGRVGLGGKGFFVRGDEIIWLFLFFSDVYIFSIVMSDRKLFYR